MFLSTLGSHVGHDGFGPRQLLGHTEILGHIELLGHTKLLGHTELLSHIELIKTKETPVKADLITIIGSVLIFEYNLKHFIVHMEAFSFRVCHK